MGRGRRGSAALVLLALVLGTLGAAVPTDRAEAEPPPPDPFYGTWSDLMSPSPADARAELDRIAAAGIGGVRQYVWWNRIETNEDAPGVFDWARTDQMVIDATARGITILPTLLYPPDWYTARPEGDGAIYPPTDPAPMVRFAEAMVARYGPNGSFWCTPLPEPLPPSCRTPYAPITAWEVWNEPDFPSWWGRAPNAGEYVELLAAVSAGIRRVDPDAEVVMGSLTNRVVAPGAFLDQIYDLGAASSFDTVAINPYGFHVAQMVGYVRSTRALMDRRGDVGKPIRVTEYGWATSGRSPNYVTDEPCQAAMMHAGTRRFGQLRTELNITSLFQFQFRDVLPPNPDGPWPHYAGLYRSDLTPKPSLGAITEAIAERPAPAGLTVDQACPEDRRALDTRAPGSIADDSFSRIQPGGWGSAEVGGPYTLDGAADSFSVADGAGKITVAAPATGAGAVLRSAPADRVDARVSVATDEDAASADGQSVALIARGVTAGDEYRVRARVVPGGAVWLAVVKVVGRRETVLGDEVLVSGTTLEPDEWLTLRVRVVGTSPTTIDAKAWRVGRPEPGAWLLTRTDSEGALQTAGSVGLRADLPLTATNAPVAFAFDDLRVSAPK